MQVFFHFKKVLLVATAIALAGPLLITRPAQAVSIPKPYNPLVDPSIYLPIIHTNPTQPTGSSQTTAIRAVRVQYNDYQNSQAEAPAIEARLRATKANLVGLSAGRVEWTYFNWVDHPEFVSSSVKDSGVDILSADSGLMP
jgi:hypothetical protein